LPRPKANNTSVDSAGKNIGDNTLHESHGNVEACTKTDRRVYWTSKSLRLEAGMAEQFLELLHSDWKEGARLFSEYAYKALTLRPPRILASQSEQDRRDMIQEIILHFIEDRCRRLKKYKKMEGVPFLAWFLRGAQNKIISMIRPSTARTEDEGPLEIIADVRSRPDEDAISEDLITIVAACLRELGDKCKILLLAEGAGFDRKQMAILLGLGAGGNVTAANDLRYCRRRLKELFDRTQNEKGHGSLE